MWNVVGVLASWVDCWDPKMCEPVRWIGGVTHPKSFCGRVSWTTQSAWFNNITSDFRGEGRFLGFLRWQCLSAQHILPPPPTRLMSEASSDLWAGSVCSNQKSCLATWRLLVHKHVVSATAIWHKVIHKERETFLSTSKANSQQHWILMESAVLIVVGDSGVCRDSSAQRVSVSGGHRA